MSTPYWQGENVTLHHGDCVTVMRQFDAESIDAIVTDPPYGLGFMGKAWDDLPPGLEWAQACLRVLKPGGHLLAFGGTRTWHRLACAIEDAGFEIRDSIAWLYGSGFPKSLDVSKAIDKAAGAQREVIGSDRNFGRSRIEDGKTAYGDYAGTWDVTAPATDSAQQWAGWGTALKPAFEPVVMARKPLTKGATVAANVLAHGTGALNIDACRIEMTSDDAATINAKHAGMNPETYDRPPGVSLNLSTNPMALKPAQAHSAGRWPANVVLDADQAATLNQQSGTLTSGGGDRRGQQSIFGGAGDSDDPREFAANTGGASRFFYVAKAPTVERPKQGGIAHPTVKPIDLMQWLVRLVTPPRGVVLDPFAGSGTTGEATIREGFESILIEREADYLPLIRERFKRPINYLLEFGDPA